MMKDEKKGDGEGCGHICNNHHTERGDKVPSIPDRGVNTGVTDTYGGSLSEGVQNRTKLNTNPGGLDWA
ncbi:hypothetical protein ED236_00475 [Pseudomethylobacillus aquaticus]|uniref:Uncharacterized protein n=1 Tax=Pseudomethylobacillus aquaticus TaxID=2676064 RepID=A0A3N0V5L7_9PROT|nr:hypothetical protein [Pseudomethylobacillus aquaticus]ROH88003.1 hypothetical protein ED236_00475 [Pseudomethylobacillus aquaticus]